MSYRMHRICIVGGGSAGLELATYLGDQLGSNRRTPKAIVNLIDIETTHLWKPLLHEVAAGSIEIPAYQTDYATQARDHGFDFHQGALTHLNRKEHTITISRILDTLGKETVPERVLNYDTLILAIGSISHFFNIPGAQEHCFALDNTIQAERFQKQLIQACTQKQKDALNRLQIVVIGGGATGVELAAELRNSPRLLAAYDLNTLNLQHDIHVVLLEGASRILPALPERTANATQRLLEKLKIEVKTNELVERIEANKIHLKGGACVEAELIVWAAGIKAPEILNTLDGLSLNSHGQMKVHPTLQSIDDPDIFGLGDCVSCPWVGRRSEEPEYVPPRAQAASQQARFLSKAMQRRLQNKPLHTYKYRDLGTIISLGSLSAVANLKDGLTSRSFTIRGWIAKIMYASLYRLHVAALHGWWVMLRDTISQWFRSSKRSRIKLH